MLQEIKRLFDPRGLLSPGVVLDEDPQAHLVDLKSAPVVEDEVERCVECGFCEPVCPSRDVTTTPRQRIVLRRETERARLAGDTDLVAELESGYVHDGVDTCAVDGMCQTACPVLINTGDLVRRLRAERPQRAVSAAWTVAARHWSATTAAAGAALDLAGRLPARTVERATDLARRVGDPDTVPRWSADLPGSGGARVPASLPTGDADAVLFSSCTGTMFGPADPGATEAFARLCKRAGVRLVVPDRLPSLCCGTPWKSKGHHAGYQSMTDRVLPALLTASRGGQLPIVCDAASCTEGLEVMAERAVAAGAEYAALRFVDSVAFARNTLLDRLTVTGSAGSIAMHRTCSTTELGINDDLDAIAQRIGSEVYEPADWGCCGFAGDRGMLHPELTASATEPEAAEITARDFDVYVSANRTCELGMSRATGKPYVHILEALERCTR